MSKHSSQYLIILESVEITMAPKDAEAYIKYCIYELASNKYNKKAIELTFLVVNEVLNRHLSHSAKKEELKRLYPSRLYEQFELYEKSKKFTPDQLEQILFGLVDFVDVSIYADPDYPAESMEVIRKALINNIPIEKHLNKRYSANHIAYIVNGLKEHLRVNYIENTLYSIEQVRTLYAAMRRFNFDLTLAADPKFSPEQMDIIIWGLQHNYKICMDKTYKHIKAIDVLVYAKPEIPASTMKELYKNLKQAS